MSKNKTYASPVVHSTVYTLPIDLAFDPAFDLAIILAITLVQHFNLWVQRLGYTYTYQSLRVTCTGSGNAPLW